jgi:hypothetical protein
MENYKNDIKIKSIGKLSFAKTVNDHDNFLSKSRSDCFDYGSWYGCDCDCPVFRTGECKVEDIEAFKIMINEDEYLSEEEITEIYRMYPQLKEL